MITITTQRSVASGGALVSSKMLVLASPGFDVGERNPYTRLLCEHIPTGQVRIDEFTTLRALLHRYDIIHIHWPEYYVAHESTLKAFIGSFRLLLLLRWCRFWGTKVIWTVHNLESHLRTRPAAERWFWTKFTRILDGYIALTKYGRDAAQKRFPALRSLPSFVIPHGNYRDAYPTQVPRAESRDGLKIPPGARVILFFGTIAPYKGISDLVTAFRELEETDVFLMIAGGCRSRSEMARLRERIDRNPRIVLRIGFVPTNEIPLLFGASDLVVLPFREILNSGSAILALSFDRPILVPRRGAMPELQRSIGQDWVRTYVGDLTPAELSQALQWATMRDRPTLAPLDDFRWEDIGIKTLEAYRSFQCGYDRRANAP